MLQRFDYPVFVNPVARDDQDGVVSGDRGQYFMGRMRIDIRSDSHCISRTCLDDGQVTRKLDVGMMLRLLFHRLLKCGIIGQTIYIVPVFVMYFDDFQLLYVA